MGHFQSLRGAHTHDWYKIDFHCFSNVCVFKYNTHTHTHTHTLRMGIRGLNKYFKKHASPKSIQTLSLEDLKGKTLVVDTSIYIYKFLETGSLLERMFLFITQCSLHNIKLLFVFDGKPRPEKAQLLQERYIKKVSAYEKYIEMKHDYETLIPHLTETQKQQVLQKMNEYQKQSIRVRSEDITQLKQMMDMMKVYYCDAPEESDVVCCYYVKKGYAWACVSDDMDMFAYNCPRVLRDWNMDHMNVLFYDFEQIKKDIKLHNADVTDVLLLVGNDYTSQTFNPFYIGQVMNWYYEFCELIIKPTQCFTKWLVFKGYVLFSHIQKLNDIIMLYDIPQHMILKKPFPLNVHSNIRITDSIKKTMMPYGFIFT